MNVIRTALAEGRPSFGFGHFYPNSLAAEAIGKSPYEWAMLDTQHGGMTLDNALPIMQALALGGTESIIRVGWNDPPLIMRALDLGAIGVIVPMIETAEEAERAADAARYPPEGARSFGPVRRYVPTADANQDVLCLVMIETVKGLENLDEIASTPGVDGIFVGPADLAVSMGLTPSFTEFLPEVLEAYDRIVAACETHGIIPSSVTLNHATAVQLLERGMRVLTHGADMRYLADGLARDASAAEAWADQHRRRPSPAPPAYDGA